MSVVAGILAKVSRKADEASRTQAEIRQAGIAGIEAEARGRKADAKAIEAFLETVADPASEVKRITQRVQDESRRDELQAKYDATALKRDAVRKERSELFSLGKWRDGSEAGGTLREQAARLERKIRESQGTATAEDYAAWRKVLREAEDAFDRSELLDRELRLLDREIESIAAELKTLPPATNKVTGGAIVEG